MRQTPRDRWMIGALMGAALAAGCGPESYDILTPGGSSSENAGTAGQTGAQSTGGTSSGQGGQGAAGNASSVDSNAGSTNNGGAGHAGAEPGLVASDKQRNLEPQVTAAEVTQLASDNTAFALDLYAKLSADSGNIFLSPYSISAALAMTYAGARNSTKAAMAEALHFTLPDSTLNAAFDYLDLELAKRAQLNLGSEQTGDPFRLRVANALWGQTGYHFEPAFLDVLAVNYGAWLQLVDFIGAPEPSRQTINAWVSDQTEKKIPELIPQGAIDSMTRLVLTNAIYFKASWYHPFANSATAPAVFHATGGDRSVAMMHEQERMGYATGQDYQAVTLPYIGGQLDMVLIVPDSGKFATVEAGLTGARLDSILTGLGSTEVKLTLPKWKFDTSFELSSRLASLGMQEAFAEGQADFSGMTGTKELFISAVIHQAFVAVDETGTEAAAATAVAVGTSAMLPTTPVELTVDRPFLFLIRDIPTQAVLFLGRVVDPI